MTNPLHIHDELLSRVPPGAQAAIAALFLVMQQRNQDLENQVADLKARLSLNSTKLHKPPPSDLIGVKRNQPAYLTDKKRGCQLKHRKADRALVQSDLVHQTFICKPTNYRQCSHGLLAEDPAPSIHRIARVFPIARHDSGEVARARLRSEPQQVII